MFAPLQQPDRWPRRLGHSVPGSMMSLAVHGALVCGALAATMTTKPAAAPAVSDTIPVVFTTILTPARHTARPDLPVLQPPGRGFQTVIPIVQVPIGIPPVDSLARWHPADYSGRGRENGIADGVPGGTGPVPTTIAPVFVTALVDEPPVVLAAPSPRYPPLLRAAGIEGEVILEAVVGRDGRAETETVRVVYASHRGFEDAAREVLERCVFRPGRIRGEAVRVLVRQSIRFAIVR
jgi:TonB family protein